MGIKNALVTGGTRGIGLAIGRMLLEEGYDLYITYAGNEEAAASCASELREYEGRFKIIRSNQACPEDRCNLVKRLDNGELLHCIVFNAGATLRKGLCEMTDDEWYHVMEVNVNAPCFLLRDLRHLIPNDGRVVFIGSMMGIFPHATSLAYGVTKSAVHALAKNLVKCFEGTGITVNAIAPGFVETDWQKNKPEFIRKNICDKTAVYRFASVDEIANAVKFCLHNAFVNGSIIEVSGGYCFK